MVSNVNQAKAPISSHPAFPAIVALWFAALLGIGSLIVPTALFEHVFAVTGLSVIFTATKAPLGFTAKLLIAVSGCIIGGVTGMLLARKVAAAQSTLSTQTSDRVEFPSAKTPIFALEELGAQSLDHPVEDHGAVEPAHIRRRTLIIPEEGVSERLPGETPLATKPIAETADRSEPQTGAELPADEWVDEWADDFPAEVDQADDLNFAEPDQEFSDVGKPGPAEIAISGADLGPQANAQNPATGMTAAQLASRPLQELGIVQLVERFALSLQQQPASAFQAREETSESPLSAITAPLPDAMGPAHADEASTPAEPSGNPAELPDALRPVGFGMAADSFLEDEADADEEDELPVIDWKAAFSVDDSEDETEEDEEFSSLLNLRKPTAEPRKSVELPENLENDPSETVAVFPGAEDSEARRKFDPPVAVPSVKAPSSEDGSAADRERTLRDALEQLQKMSGVG